MKKAFSIVFLAIFLFNVGGYYLVFWGLRTHASANLVQRLDANDYTEDDLVEIAVPLALPYPTEQNEYQRTDGKFEYNGKFYNMVKQKHSYDTLYVLCIRNHQETKLVSTMNEYSDLANNLPASSKNTLDLFGKLFKDYTLLSFAVISYDGWSALLTYARPSIALAQQSYPVTTPPPDFRS